MKRHTVKRSGDGFEVKAAIEVSFVKLTPLVGG